MKPLNVVYVEFKKKKINLSVIVTALKSSRVFYDATIEGRVLKLEYQSVESGVDLLTRESGVCFSILSCRVYISTSRQGRGVQQMV